MHRAILSLWSCALLAAQEPPPAFVEVVPASTTVWLHEPCEVLVRIGFDAAFFATSAVPLFQQRLDQPFQVVVPWLVGAEDRAVEFVPAAAATPGSRIAVGDSVATATSAGRRQQGERTFELLELRYRWLPLASGVSAIAPVELRYAFAKHFAADFLRGREPLDRQETSVLSPALQLAVRALPTAGRPAGFAGAVGEFTVEAKVSTPDVAVGGAFTFEVAVTGTGNLDRFAPMAWPTLWGFHVQGLIERRAPGVRTFVFDVLALRAGQATVPAVPFAAFSPARGKYVTHMTGPVPIVVRRPDVESLPPRVQELIDAFDREARPRVSGWWPWLVLAFVVLVLAGRRGRRRRRHRREALRSALGALERAREPADVLRAFELLCAQCAGDKSFAGDDTLGRLGTSDLVAEGKRLHAALDAARFGGVPVPHDEVLLLATALRTHAERSLG